MIISILMICFVMSFIIDVSGFVENVKRMIWRMAFKTIPYRGFNAKPFDCSLCVTFWTVGIYLTVTHGLSLRTIFTACAAAFFADICTELILAVKELILRVLSRIK